VISWPWVILLFANTLRAFEKDWRLKRRGRVGRIKGKSEEREEVWEFTEMSNFFSNATKSLLGGTAKKFKGDGLSATVARTGTEEGGRKVAP